MCIKNVFCLVHITSPDSDVLGANSILSSSTPNTKIPDQPKSITVSTPNDLDLSGIQALEDDLISMYLLLNE